MSDGNARWIGIFVTAGLAAIVGLLVVFGGISLRSDPIRLVAFFDQSVNGLTPGAAVKFRGVPIGTVERIALRVPNQRADSTAVPVIIAIDRLRMERDLGVSDDLIRTDRLEEVFARGLAARLNLESFITGQLFVELDFSDRTPARPHLVVPNEDWVEVPTLLSPIEQLTEDIVDLIGGIQEIDFAGISVEIKRLTKASADAIETIDFAALSKEAQAIATRLRVFLESDVAHSGIGSVLETAAKIGAAADEARLLLVSIREDGFPLGEGFETLLVKAGAALEAFEGLTSEGGSLLNPDTEWLGDLSQSIREITLTARSLRQLVDLLERNPQSVLSGRERRSFQPSPPAAP